MKTEEQIRTRLAKIQAIDSEYPLVNVASDCISKILLWVLNEPLNSPDIYYCLKCNIIHAEIECPICKDKVIVKTEGV